MTLLAGGHPSRDSRPHSHGRDWAARHWLRRLPVAVSLRRRRWLRRYRIRDGSATTHRAGL